MMENERVFNEIGYRREEYDRETVELRKELYKGQNNEAKRNADEHEAIGADEVMRAWEMLHEAHRKWSKDHGADEHASFSIHRNDDGELVVTVMAMEETEG